MEVSAESNAKFVAFRQLVYRCSQHLSREEVHAIVYIRLYKEREIYKDVDALTVLSKLETDDVFSPWKPEGLLDIVKDLKRHDLTADIKEFLKKKWTKGKKAAGNIPISEKSGSDEDLHLKATFQVVISQATVLMQQIEMFQRATIQGHSRETTKEIIGLAAQTAQALASRLTQVHSDLYPTSSVSPPHANTNNTVSQPAATTHCLASSEPVRLIPVGRFCLHTIVHSIVLILDKFYCVGVLEVSCTGKCSVGLYVYVYLVSHRMPTTCAYYGFTI